MMDFLKDEERRINKHDDTWKKVKVAIQNARDTPYGYARTHMSLIPPGRHPRRRDTLRPPGPRRVLR